MFENEIKIEKPWFIISNSSVESQTLELCVYRRPRT